MYSVQKVFVFHQNLWNKIKQACICPEFTFKILFSRILGKLEIAPYYAKKWRRNKCSWWKVLNKLLSFSGSPSTTNIVLQKTVKSCLIILHIFWLCTYFFGHFFHFLSTVSLGLLSFPTMLLLVLFDATRKWDMCGKVEIWHIFLYYLLTQ